jgi:hypothetical protein
MLWLLADGLVLVDVDLDVVVIAMDFGVFQWNPV